MPATIFETAAVKALRQSLNLNDNVSVLSGDDDPTSVAKSAPRGSIYMRSGASGGQVYRKIDDGSTTNWVILGSGAGGGSGKNYWENSEFDNTTGVSTYDDGGAYVDGDGGSPTAISVATTNVGGEVLAGNNSLKISKAASDGSGEGVTFLTATLDRADQGSKLHGVMSIDFTDANYTGGDLSIKAYDVTNASIIPVTVEGAEDDSIPGTQGKVRFNLDTESNTTTIRLSLHLESDSATGSAWDLFLDELSIGPQALITVTPRLPAIDAGAITISAVTTAPTKGSTVDVDKVTYSRDGEYAFITYDYYQASATGAAAGSGDYLFELPAGLQIDTSHPSYRADTGATEGRGGLCVGGGGMSGANQEWRTTAYIYDSTRVRITAFGAAGDHREEQYVSSASFPLTTANVAYNFSIKVPIAGWQSNAVLGANQKTFKSTEISWTEVSALPTKFGEYWPLEKGASVITYSDGATPTNPPSSTDGFRVDVASGGAASTSGQPMAYVLNIGKNKSYAIDWYSGTGLSGEIDVDTKWSSGGSLEYGYTSHYEKDTGNLFVYHPLFLSTTATRYAGISRPGPTGTPVNASTAYFVVRIGESPADLFIEQAKSSVRVKGFAGHGSTNSRIPYFSTIIQETGSAITLDNSSTLGASFTINEPGLYSIFAQMSASASTRFGVSLNSSELSTNIDGLTNDNDALSIVTVLNVSPVTANPGTLRLSKGDVIRLHTKGASIAVDNLTRMTVTKVGV